MLSLLEGSAVHGRSMPAHAVVAMGMAKASTAKHSNVCFKWADHDLGFSSRKCPYSAGECRWAHKWPDGAAKRAYEKKNKKKKRRRAGSDSE